MTIFAPFENLQLQDDKALICIADRFSWFAFLLPPIWAISNGMWMALVWMIVSIIGLGFIDSIIMLPTFSLYFLASLWLGFAANGLRGAKLMNKGWLEKQLLIAPNLMQAERRYFGRMRRFNRSKSYEK